MLLCRVEVNLVVKYYALLLIFLDVEIPLKCINFVQGQLEDPDFERGKTIIIAKLFCKHLQVNVVQGCFKDERPTPACHASQTMVV